MLDANVLNLFQSASKKGKIILLCIKITSIYHTLK